MPSKVEIGVVADVKDAVKKLDDLSGEVGDVGTNVETMGGRIDTAFKGIATAAAGYLSVEAVKEFWNFSNEVAAMRARVDATFGENIGDMEEWAEDNRRIFGESALDVLSYAAIIQPALEGLGLPEMEANDLAQDFTILAEALAFYYPEFESAQEVLQGIADATRSGDWGFLEDLGVSREEVEAFEEYVTAVGEMDEAQREGLVPAALYAAIFGANAEAMEAFSEAMDGAEGKQRALASDWDQMKTDAAELSEPFKELAIWIGTRLIGAFGKLEEWGAFSLPGVVREFQENLEILGAAFDALGGKIDGVLEKLGNLASFGDFDFGNIVPDLGGSWIDPRTWPNPLDSLDPGQWFNSGSRGGSGVTLVVNAPPLTDPAEVGRHAVEAIEAYERGNGAAWRGAS